jgi:hypothetical protein
MDLNLIKNKLSALQSSGQKKEKVDYSLTLWKPKQEGKYQIRIVPSKFDKQNPFKEVYLHYGLSKFPIYALTNWGEKDPIVEFAKQLRGTNDRANWQLAKKLDPKMRVFAPVIVRGEEDKGVRLWEFGKEIYLQLLGLAEDEDYGDFTDVYEGFDFTLEAVMGDIGGRQGLKSSLRPKRKTSSLSDDAKQIEAWLDNQPDILELQGKFKKSFDDLKTILQNFLDPEDESQDEDVVEDVVDIKEEIKSEAKSNYSLSTKKSAKQPVDKFDELFDDEEENEDDLPF